MSILQLREWIESKTPWWAIPLIILVAVMIGSYLDFISYRNKLK